MSVTLDDTSPFISWQGNWGVDNWTGWEEHQKDYHNGTRHFTPYGNTSCTLLWQGTSVNVMGSNLGNHGWYSISLDGQAKRYFNGYHSPNIFGQSKFNMTGLEDKNHTLVLMNEPDYVPDEPYTNIVGKYTDLDSIIIDGTAWPAGSYPIPPPVAESSSSSPSTSTTSLPSSSSPSSSLASSTSPTATSQSGMTASITSLSSTTQTYTEVTNAALPPKIRYNAASLVTSGAPKEKATPIDG